MKKDIYKIFCMKPLLFLLGMGLLFADVQAQTAGPANFATAINTSALQKHLAYIAGEETQGRETGTEGQRKAAAYIEEQFRAMGLQQPPGLGGYQQHYPLYQDILVSTKLSIGKEDLRFGTDYTAPVTSNFNQKLKAKAIVFVGYGISSPLYDDYAGVDVKGKVVLFFLGEPKKADSTYLLNGSRRRGSEWSFPGQSLKLKTAMEKGAVAALIISPATDTFATALVATAQKSNVYYPRNTAPSINAATLSHQAAGKLLGDGIFANLLAKANTGALLNSEALPVIESKFKLDYKKKRDISSASNVLGYVEGSDKKDEFVFLTAHYDHLGVRGGKIYYGADDDGSGTVGVMQMAAAFAQAKAAGNGPRRSVVFMTVSGEEKGLWGSEYYTANPLFPLDKTSVDLNIDMVGRIDTERTTADTLNYVYVIGHDKLSSDLAVINEAMNKQYTNLVLDYKYDDPNDRNRIYFRSDHYNFAKKGVPILFFYDGMLKADYHRPTDTIDKINWALYEKRVQMIFYTAWEMANREAMLKRDIPLPEAAR
jgi:Zn-dependent M28 family amino/carboxypeptidase